ncbi:uncharacterized protein LOC134692308 [Mytilus trossulus]|uniref:uncharacterized protein LOC134692308 n=1 Tax=Mytilus trossulus TaxID=6551 RepID=UPI00300690F4
MLRVSAIVLFSLFIIENVCANACGPENCETTIDIPLITKLNAPLKAELDITSLTSQLKELIGKEVKQAVFNAVNDLVENITDMRFQIAVDRLQNSSNEMEVALTTCVSSNIQTSGTAVLTFFAGINSLAIFKTTGLFLSEQSGLYFISVTIDSHTPSGSFSIYHNSAIVINAYVYDKASGSNEADHSSTAVSAVFLNEDDTLSVKTVGSLFVHSIYSCMTIIKIK